MIKIACFSVAFCLFLAATPQCQGQNNDFKVNLSSLALKNFSFQYERGLTNHISVALGFRFMPKGAIPFQSQAQNLVNNNDIDVSALQVGNTAITPEVRFYLGSGRQRGFYIAPYARYATFNLDLPVNFETQTGSEQAIFSGKVNSFSGGLMFGMQYTIAKVIVLDIWLIGAHYGGSNGNASFTPSQPLTPDEQQGLQSTLNNINIKPFTFTSNVTAAGATMQTNGPWAGIRGAGINVGIRF